MSLVPDPVLAIVFDPLVTKPSLGSRTALPMAQGMGHRLARWLVRSLR